MPLRPRRPLSAAVAAGFLFAAAAHAAEAPRACASDPHASGLVQRLDNLSSQMRRIEETHGRPEQRALMDLQVKAMQEGLRELRGRGISESCRVEVLHALMEQMLRLHLAERESAAR